MNRNFQHPTTLTELYNDRRFLLTAHRGASFEYPENTGIAMQKAIEAGADFIEFDLRSTADHVPVLLHDTTIDRTSDGKGRPENFLMNELRQLNFSYFVHFERLEKPLYEHLPIPTFEEILQEFQGCVCMNIQINIEDDIAMAEACRLFSRYSMYDFAYLTVSPDRIGFIRSIDSKIELCITPGWLERTHPENLDLCAASGCRFVQPVAKVCDRDTFAAIRERKLRGNVFLADDQESASALTLLGAEGVFTNKIELLSPLRNSGKLTIVNLD
ncbi:MAG: hypothetical protein JXR78_16870 [Victivallales bacterium]|nr:hypothetical protein [Victivallales bacterium]